MKKLIFLFSMLAGILAVNAQTSTIVDYGNYLEIQYEGGDTIGKGKDASCEVEIVMHNAKIYVMTSRTWNSGALTRPTYDPWEFGYSTSRELFDYLCCMYFHEYTENYHYTGGNLDTVKYYYNTTLMHTVVYGYTNDTLTSKTPLNSLGQ